MVHRADGCGQVPTESRGSGGKVTPESFGWW